MNIVFIYKLGNCKQVIVTLFLALFFESLALDPAHAITWKEWEQKFDPDQIDSIVQKCINQPQGWAQVRSCTSSINAIASAISATNELLKALESEDGAKRLGVKKTERRGYIKPVKEIKQALYVYLIPVYASRGISYAKFKPEKAIADCEKAEEIRRNLRYNSRNAKEWIASCFKISK